MIELRWRLARTALTSRDEWSEFDVVYIVVQSPFSDTWRSQSQWLLSDAETVLARSADGKVGKPDFDQLLCCSPHVSYITLYIQSLSVDCVRVSFIGLLWQSCDQFWPSERPVIERGCCWLVTARVKIITSSLPAFYKDSSMPPRLPVTTRLVLRSVCALT